MKHIIYTLLVLCLCQGISLAQSTEDEILTRDQCPTVMVKIESRAIIEKPGQIYPSLIIPDADGDGISDFDECPTLPCNDFDNNGTPDYQQEDSDNDGLSDRFEGNTDFDGDGDPNYIDLDSDQDGTPDKIDICYLEAGTYPDPCKNNDRFVFWVHGYKGNENSWKKVASHETDVLTNAWNKNGNYQARSYFPDYNLWQTSLEASAQNIWLDIKGELDESNENFPDTERNFVIAHSLGGLAMRKLGKVTNPFSPEGKPAYNGLITFGTPHLGAAASNTIEYNPEYLESFLQETCKALSSGPSNESASEQEIFKLKMGQLAVAFGTVTGVVNKLCGTGLGLAFDPIVNILKTGIEKELTTTAAANVPAMNTEHNAAFFGVEDDSNGSLFARFSGAIKNSPTSEELYKGDLTDQKGLDAMASDLDDYANKYHYYVGKGLSSWTAIGQKSNFEIANEYLQGVKWFDRVNGHWKTIVGGTETITYQIGCQCVEEDQNGNIIVWDSGGPNTDCGTLNSNNNFVECHPYLQVKYVHKPSDGFILAESAMNMPGATYDPTFMPSSNHFQMKNDSNTEFAMEAIFLRGLDGSFFGTPIR